MEEKAPENPFEGSVNGVPIIQISRIIEIDMLDKRELLEPIVPKNNIVLYLRPPSCRYREGDQ